MQYNAIGDWPIVRFLEMQFTQIRFRLLALFHFGRCHVHAGTNTVVPCGRPGNARARINARKARVTEQHDRTIGDDRKRSWFVPAARRSPMGDGSYIYFVRHTKIRARTTSTVG
jgi:hypothetical protein